VLGELLNTESRWPSCRRRGPLARHLSTFDEQPAAPLTIAADMARPRGWPEADPLQ